MTLSEQVANDVPADLSALAWVTDELRRTLENAHKALHRQQREFEGARPPAEIDGMALPALQQARSLFHQGAGALDMVGQVEGARLLRANEQASLRFAQRCDLLTADAVNAVERASFALLDYLRRQLSGKEVSPLALFPQYREVQMLAGADRIHPADLWRADGHWQGAALVEHEQSLGSASAAGAEPLRADAETRGRLEQYMLSLLRGPVAPAATKMSELFAGLAAASADRGTSKLAGLWAIAAGFFEAQAHGRLDADLYAKRLTSRLLAQVRLAERGQSEVSDRLTQDLLFFCSRARPGDDDASPRLAAVRQAFSLPASAPAPFDYEQESLGRYDPALIPLARRRVESLKESWSSATAGQSGLAASLREQATAVAEVVRKLHAEGEHMARALDAAVTHVAEGKVVPSPGLAMEVATGLLCLDAALDDADVAEASFGGRLRQLAERIDLARQGRTPGPVESWMEDLYRRASDRQTMGSVVQELRSQLADVELQLDKFNRNPADREPLVPVPAKLSAMRGVLSVLGLDQAGHAVVHMRDEVDSVLARFAGEHDPAAASALSEQAVGRLAANVGALGFLIDLLGVQPLLAKALFKFDAGSGRLEAVMGRAAAPADESPAAAAASATPPLAGEARLIEQVQTLAQVASDEGASKAELLHKLDELAQQAVVSDEKSLADAAKAASRALASTDDQADAAAVRQELAQAMNEYAAPPPPAPAPAPAAVSATATAEDDEMLDVFFEEAAEVIEGARASLARLDEEPQHFESISTVRRAFHTLKGSSRMVGLKDFGEAAWACEQLYNTRLADAVIEAEPALRRFSMRAFDELERWVGALAARDAAGFHSAPLVRAATALREGVDPESVSIPVLAPEPALAADDLPLHGQDEPDTEILDEDDFIDTQSGLPDLADLPPIDPGFTLDLDPLPPAAPDESPAPVPAPLAFELDLAALDDAERAAPAAAAATFHAGEPVEEIAEEIRIPVADADADADAAPAGEPAADPFESAPSPLDGQPPVDDALALDDAENYKVIGPLRIGLGLFNIFLNEADEQSRRLCTSLAEWEMELPRPVGEDAVALAHSLAGNSATVGHADLSALARRLEHALETSISRDVGAEEARLYVDVADEIRRLLHQFAAGFLQPPLAALLARFDAFQAHLHELAVQAAQAEHERHLRQAEAAKAVDVPEVADVVPSADAAHDPADFVDAPIAAPEVIESLELDDAAFPDLAPAPAAENGPPVAAPVAAAAAVAETPAAAAVSESGLRAVRFSVLEDAAAAAASGPRTEISAPEVDAPEFARDLDAVDAIDPELFEIFTEEAHELLPSLASHLRAWEQAPEMNSEAFAALRALHTLKGSARLAGAMRLGELAHRLETAFEERVGGRVANPPTMAMLHSGVDALDEEFQRLKRAPAAAAEPAIEPAPAAPPPAVAPPLAPEVVAVAVPVPDAAPAVAEPAAVAQPEPAAEPVAQAPAPAAIAAPGNVPPAAIDWSRFSSANPARVVRAAATAAAANPTTSMVRVRAPLLDRLVNQAGEVSITRSRMETDVTQMRVSLRELTENLDRLRRQLRDIELQADTQIASRMEASRSSSVEFDPLEMDRFTRFQELTRMMAESVNDVATVQRSLQQTVQSAEDEMAAQARLTRGLQEDLLRARMVPFDALSERLYRVVRQAAKETSTQVRLNVEGSAIELDRSVLDRMAGAFEHLLRNAVVHGIESPDVRRALDKDPVGTIDVSLAQQGNEVRIQIRDDGHGLDLQRIEAKGRNAGLIAPDAHPTAAELANLIFMPGFSTAEEVTELAGRGVGMDAVRNDVTALGGRIETASAPGRGTAFTLLLPLTTAVTRVVQLRCGELTVAIPASLVEVVRRASVEGVEQAYLSGQFRDGADDIPFFWLGALLQTSTQGALVGRTTQVILVRSAEQRIALHVDQVVGNQEVVVKNLGPQLARLPGLAGMSLLATGEVVPIYNPVALAAFYGQRPGADGAAPRAPEIVQEVEEARTPLVLVVDDSLTVRRVTQRLLAREGFRVAVAKDGLDALEQLAAERPAVMLTDIEMPRMDGFDLLRNVRHDSRWRDLPVIMITSRIAQKHRDLAMQLGANHYLGKPYDEEQLVALIQQNIANALPA
jgi:chemosensory pili system protein ChpA (sensor histidine kinase/response regulator)